jgi:dihydropyrimidinase
MPPIVLFGVVVSSTATIALHCQMVAKWFRPDGDGIARATAKSILGSQKVPGRIRNGVAKYVMTPPLRAPHHQDRLWHGIRRGDVDVVSTDHCPFCMLGQKDAGRDNFLEIPNGIGGVEYRLLLLFDRGVAAGRISLEQLVAITATNPAKLFGLHPRKGTLMVGADADVVVLDPDAQTRLSVSSSPSNVDYSIYEGWSVAGAIRCVLSRGTVVVADGAVKDRRGHGRFVARGSTSSKP